MFRPAILNFSLINETATLRLGAQLALHLKAPCIIWLQGDLGMGKTTFTRGLLQALGHQGAVKSPTYTLVESYRLPDFTLHHFDLYRFQTPEEWLDAGLDELITPDSIALIEWPLQGEAFTPPADITLTLLPDNNGRQARLSAETCIGQQILTQLTL